MLVGDSARVELEALLACPRCHGPLLKSAAELRCRDNDCGERLVADDGIVRVASTSSDAFFDDHHAAVTETVHDCDGEGLLGRAQRMWLEDLIRASRVVLDVGCGSRARYGRPRDGVQIGLDQSLQSLRCNAALDLAIHGSVTAMPLADRSVDLIVASFLLHHLVGDSLDANRRLLAGAFAEFARVLRPGGGLVVCEVSPWWLFWRIEQLAWNRLKRLIGSRALVHFWSRAALSAAGTALPPGTRLAYRRADLPWYGLLRPVFILPWLRIPRGLYPFEVGVFHWTLPGPGVASAPPDYSETKGLRQS